MQKLLGRLGNINYRLASKFPDFNIIEHVWAYCKDWCDKNKSSIKNKDYVWKFCVEAFFSKKVHELIQTCYGSY